MYVFCFACLLSALYILYLKYRVIITGERCSARIIGIVDKDGGYSIKGVRVKKHAYVTEIRNERYYTAHGCLITALGKRKIGREIVVYKNEKYGREVFQSSDFRIEILALLLFLIGYVMIK